VLQFNKYYKGDKVMKNIILICFVLVVSCVTTYATILPPDTIKITQGNTPNNGDDTTLVLPVKNPPLNNAWKKINNPNSTAIPYTYQREEDVMWSKRVWREIDLREKMNLNLYYPLTPVRDRVSFTQTLIDAVTKGYVLGKGDTTGKSEILGKGGNTSDTFYLTAYENEDFKSYYNKKMISNIFAASWDSMPTDTNGDGVTDIWSKYKNETSLGDIQKIRLTEIWFFDKERSVMEVRTIGVCLLKDEYKYLQDGSGLMIKQWVACRELLWIYYPEARALLSQAECYNAKNDGARMSFDDIFWKRLFNGYVVKVENVYDRPISTMGQDIGYLKGMDALIEGQKVMNDIIEFEHNLWEY
jgi:gliding motility associated protien GldN